MLMLPVIAAQAVWVRVTTPRLPAASGPCQGVAGGGQAAPLRLGVVGESTAAGCGVDSHDDGFAGAFARELAHRSARPVAWQVVGRHGANSHHIRHELLPRLAGEFDIAVVLLGVNDVLDRRSPGQWREDLTGIVADLTARAGRVVVTGVPPFEAFPSLPRTLGRYLAGRGRALDEIARQICFDRPNTTWVGEESFPPMGPDFFARDGFHPSAFGYRRWAELIAARLH